jgi:hypothetical protein
MTHAVRHDADPYRAFLEGKVKLASYAGFTVDPTEINPALMGHQGAIVQWAAAGGRRAIFASFGLGKSVIQVELLRLCLRHVAHAMPERLAAGLIVAPYGAGWEIEKDAREILGVQVKYIRNTWEAYGPGLYWTNYECVREGHVEPAHFACASLDEADVLRSFGSKTYQSFLPLFEAVPFRFVATATPSPNRYKELIHYAGYLGVMDTGQALTRFFQRDSSQAGNLQLLPHMEEQFWLWVASWALFVTRPSDLGFSDEGYDLPPLDVRWHEVPVDHRRQGDARRAGRAVPQRRPRRHRGGAGEARHHVARIAKLTEPPGVRPAGALHPLARPRGRARADRTGRAGGRQRFGSQPVEERAARIGWFADGFVPVPGDQAGAGRRGHEPAAALPLGGVRRRRLQVPRPDPGRPPGAALRPAPPSASTSSSPRASGRRSRC